MPNKHVQAAAEGLPKSAAPFLLPVSAQDDLMIADALITTVFLALGNEDGLDAGDPECLRLTLNSATRLINGVRSLGGSDA